MASTDTTTAHITLAVYTDFAADTAYNPGRPMGWDVTAVTADYAAAEELVAHFPKGVGLRACHLSGSTEGTGSIRGHAKLAADGVNGGRNETGIRRLHSLLKAAERAGIEVRYSTRSANSYPTLAAALADLA